MIFVSSVAAFAVAPAVNWNYDLASPFGPHNWAKTYPACEGPQQSPVELTSSLLINQPFRFNWTPSVNATFNATAMSLTPLQPISITHLDTPFFLKNTHFHGRKSEHSVDGLFHALEAHFLHVSPNGTMLVVGMLIKLSETNTTSKFISQFVESANCYSDDADYLSKSANTTTTSVTNTTTATNSTQKVFEFESIFGALNGTSYYNYVGSLTVPPCTEGVHWFISNVHDADANKDVGAAPPEISQRDLECLVTFHNARPIQRKIAKNATSTTEGVK